MHFSFYQIASFFYIYSFIGWCVEVAYQGVTNGKLVNRGFLNGPVCPIYGFGMVGVLILLTPLSGSLPALFFGGVIITTAIELFGGWILDKIFHMRWWDYSDKPFNLHGYICLQFSLIWGIAVTFVVRLVHPLIAGLVNRIPHIAGLVILIVLTVAMLSDIIVTYKTVIGIKKGLNEAEKIAAGLRELSDSLTEKVGSTAIAATERAERSREKIDTRIEAAKVENERKRAEIAVKRQALEEKYDKMKARYTNNLDRLSKQSRRMVKAFPQMRVSGQKKTLREYIETKRETLKKSG